MKSYKLDLSAYEVEFEMFVIEDGKRVLKRGTEPFDIKLELSSILRVPGIYDNGIQMVDGVNLAKQIKTEEKDFTEISDEELALMKSVLNKLISRKEDLQAGIIPLGGPRYEELIVRVFGIQLN